MMIARKGDWLSARVGEELVMMSEAKGKYIGLTAVGTRIWELLAEPRPFDSLCHTLEAEFDVAPEVCRAEVDTFLQTLKEHDAITITGSKAG